MSIVKKIKFLWSFITDPGVRFYYYSAHGKYQDMPDDEYLKMMFKARVKRELDLENPVRLSDKLQWLKIYDRNPEYSKMVDKYEIKKIVADKIGAEHVVPALNVWDKAEDIDITNLPDQFVLKCTHDSGGFVICKDKANFDLDAAKEKLGGRLKRNYFYGDREWPYKNVKPRIIAEPFIDTLGKPDSVEYKLTCYHGKVVFTTICTGIAHDELKNRKNDHYDRDWKPMPWYTFYEPSGEVLAKKPEYIDEMIEMAEKLSEGIPYLRVDFYRHEGRIYFGEVTFYTWGGFLIFEPDEWDIKLGEMLELPEKRTE